MRRVSALNQEQEIKLWNKTLKHDKGKQAIPGTRSSAGLGIKESSVPTREQFILQHREDLHRSREIHEQRVLSLVIIFCQCACAFFNGERR